jgi:hypothetical protein
MLTRIFILFFFVCVSSYVKGQCFLVPSEVCVGDCGPLFYLQNDPPGTTYQWSISCGTITNDTFSNPHTVCFISSGTCLIEVIITIPGEEPDTCSMTVEVLPPSLSVIFENVCDGDSIEINGMYYTPGFYSDTIQGGSVNGCDSILLITVNGLPFDTTNITYTGCEGDGYSVVVNNIIYNESTPAGTEILTGSDGCDSIVIVDLDFLPISTSEFLYIGCQGDSFSITINSVIYNESNPTGVEVITASNGCDSVITVSLTFFMTVHDTISYHGCSGDGYSVTVGGSIYNENNPAGIDTLIGGCDTIVVIDLQFDTLIASLTLSGNELCAAPAGMEYTWYTCDSIPLSDSTQCITVAGIGCVCVIVSNGICSDTICQSYEICDLSCDIIAPDGGCVGDSVLLSVNTNVSDSAIFNWTITLDSFAGVMYNDVESISEVFYTPGCYVIDLQINDLGCLIHCSDTLCITDKPLADLCCTNQFCDSAFLTITLFGTPPFTIAISDGQSIDTIGGIMDSQFEHQVFPPFFENTLYKLLWVQDSSASCFGSIIHDSAYVYLYQKPEIVIVQTGNTLCIEPLGFAYNWTNCSTPATISPGRCFTPDSSGCYCAYVHTPVIGCFDSECIDFVLTDISEPSKNQNVRLWYYADQRSILIEYSGKYPDDLQFQLFDIQGRAVAYNQIERIDPDLFRVTLPQHVPSLVIVSVSTADVRYSQRLFIPY